MINIKLDLRLSEIFSCVTGPIVADIGCDHGKVSFNLLKSNIADFVYISDISAPSLDKAINLLNENGFAGKFKAIVSDGFKEYDTNITIDTAIISGMGGYEITNILKSNLVNVKKFVLQPQHNESDLKRYLIDNNYNILKDYIIKQKDKFYNVIVCVKGEREYSEYEEFFGEENFTRNSADFIHYLEYEYQKTMKIIDSVDEDRKSILLKYLDLINKAKSRLGV